VPVTLAGVFRYEPPPAGAYSARLATAEDVAAGVRVRVLPGRPPGLFVSNASGQVLTVLDQAGVPFLRIGPDGVDANIHSAAWTASGRSADVPAAAAPDDALAPRWQRVARASSYSWIEPRLAGDDDRRRATGWEIPALLGDMPLRVAGQTVWKNRSGERNVPRTD
jgi:hypothetical protein